MSKQNQVQRFYRLTEPRRRPRQRWRAFLAISAVCCFACAVHAQPASPDALRAGFDSPPDEAKPRTWWHWVSGNVSKEGITLDLEAMKRVGIAEAQVFNVNQGPMGSVRTLSPEWHELTKFAIQEADRVGIELAFQNCAGWSTSGGPWVTPEQSMQFVYWSETAVTGGRAIQTKLPPSTPSPGAKDIAVLAFPTRDQAAARETPLLTDGPAKAGFEAKVTSRVPTTRPVEAGQIIPKEGLIDLTSRMSPDGELTWDAPAGNWTVLRIGHASNGRKNHPSVPEATGLEVDKLSAEAVTRHFNEGLMGQVIRDAGPLAGKSLKYVLADSWEAGSLNWTPKLRDAFMAKCGYDPIPWLPAVTGRVIGSVDQTERFLWDFRRVIADLVASNHYGVLQKLSHDHGLQFYAEAPGIGMPTVADALQCKARTDIPMGEFWLHGDGSADVKEAASAAHINGLRWVAAESFTARTEDASWKNDPFSIKALGDKHFCLGLNRIVFHRYAHQPFADKVPGVTMGPWGLNFERTQTWWEPGAAYLKYLARCQWLLSQGRPVSDVLFFYGEWAPNTLPARSALKPVIPAGYDYDGCDYETLAKATVKDGNVVLPGGMSYRVLALAESDSMTPQTLAVVEKLVKAGATVVGMKPTKSPSLAGYPHADEQVKQLADAVWAKGGVIDSLNVADAFNRIGLAADFSTDAASRTGVMAVHRRTASDDLYFVSNQRYQNTAVTCSFRVAGKVPQLWHPDTGEIENVPAYGEENGVTTLTLFLPPAGSVFVVFRDAPRPADWATTLRTPQIDAVAKAAQSVPVVRILKAVYQPIDGSPGLDVTQRLSDAWTNDPGPLPVNNNTMGGDPKNGTEKQLKVDYSINGHAAHLDVAENASFDLPTGVAAPPPDVELRHGGAGELKLVPWVATDVSVSFASGKTWKRTVSSPATVRPIEGAWDVSFPPKLGAPPKATFSALESWTSHADPGIKFFSGTATYRKTIVLEATMLGGNKVVQLDLGEVKNLAEVTLNGQNLGVLWKPPFRVDIGKAAKVGENQLEVKVTNLWPNRLIGDEALPKERRVTWTTFNPFTASSPLLPSGLLGPVTIRSAEAIDVK